MLALLAAALVAVNLVQGIRIEVSMPAAERFVSSAHQSVTLTANQQLKPIDASSVTVTPAADFSLALAANRLSITFEETLEAGTEYRVRVNDVVGSFDTSPHTVEKVFSTPAAALVVLRHSDAGDSLVSVPVGSATAEPTAVEDVIFEAPQITEFTVAGDRVVVATADADLSKRLVSVPLVGGEVTSITLPGPGFASALDAVGEYGLVGFRFYADPDANDYEFDRVLFVSENGGTPRPVPGLDGADLQVFDWQFVPAKPALIAQDFDKDLLLIDLRQDRQAVPLGNYADLVSVGNDGTGVVVGDAVGLSLYDLTTGSVQPISFDLADGRIAYASDTVALAGERGIVRSYSVVDPATYLFDAAVTVQIGDDTTSLFTSATDGSTLVRLTASPNDRLLAIETRSAADVTSTRIIDLSTGEVVQVVAGAAGRWR